MGEVVVTRHVTGPMPSELVCWSTCRQVTVTVEDSKGAHGMRHARATSGNTFMWAMTKIPAGADAPA